MQTLDPQNQPELDRPQMPLPAYELPVVVTYTDEQLLDALGPAQASPYGPPG